MDQALHGIRVLELSEGLAGPAAAKFLADFGAEVIKVEPPEGDYARSLGYFPGDVPDIEQSAQFVNFNRNKLGITLDVFTEDGRALVERLIADTDILISSYTPQQFDQLGLHYDLLKAINPAIVVLSITPWGLTGPYKDYKASEIVLDGFGHCMSAFGVKDREPLAMGGGLREHYAGRMGTLAAMGAYLTAERSGVGQMIDLSMTDALLGSADRRSTHILRWQYNKRPFQRIESGAGTGNLRGGFTLCGDGWLHVSLQPGDATRLLEIIEATDLLEDAGFQPIAEHWGDSAFQSELSGRFLGWSMQHTRVEIEAIARANRLPIYPVNHFSDVLRDPHLNERGYFIEVEHPVAGKTTHPGAPFRMERAGYEQRRPAPLLGQHNADILGGRLGLSPEEIARLEAAGVIARSGAAKRFGEAAPAEAPAPRPTRVPLGPPRLPLEGVRVIDMTLSWAGPSATALLGDLGAEVVRVESLQFFPVVTRGGVVRPESKKQMEEFANPLYNGYVDFEPGERPWNRFANFNSINRNKLSMTADLRRAEGLEIFKKLLAISDIVVDNNAFGVMEKLGLGDSVMRAVNPRLINVSMPLYGNSGRNRAISGMGSVVDSWSGILTMRGYRDFDIGASQVATHMDSASGPGAAFAVLLALREREQSGLGQFIDFSQSENMLQAVGEYFVDCQWNNRNPSPLGDRDRWSGIQGAYRCAGNDEWVVLTARTDEEWLGLRRAMGDPEWARDERFSTAKQRYALHNEINARISAWTEDLDPYDAMHRLQAEGVAAAKVLNEEATLNDPHIRERGFFVQMTHQEAGTHMYPGHQWKTSGPPLRLDSPPPLLGEHNEYCYKTLLGYSDADYERLERELHIGMDYLPGLLPGRG